MFFDPIIGVRIATLASEEDHVKQIATLLGARGYQIQNFPLRTKSSDSPIRFFAPHLIILADNQDDPQNLSALKKRIGQIPLLYIESPGSKTEMTSFLDAGADDFIHNPFDPRILVARAENLLRRELKNGRMNGSSKTNIISGKLSMNLLAREATLRGKNLPLTRFEFDLLAFLLKNEGVTLSRQEILAEVWKYPEDVQTRTLDKHVETLRKKLGAKGRSLATVHGLGYLFKPESVTPPPPR